MKDYIVRVYRAEVRKGSFKFDNFELLRTLLLEGDPHISSALIGFATVCNLIEGDVIAVDGEGVYLHTGGVYRDLPKEEIPISICRNLTLSLWNTIGHGNIGNMLTQITKPEFHFGEDGSELLSLLKMGKKIEAIIVVKKRVPCTLVEAKRYVEGIIKDRVIFILSQVDNKDLGFWLGMLT